MALHVPQNGQCPSALPASFALNIVFAVTSLIIVYAMVAMGSVFLE